MEEKYNTVLPDVQNTRDNSYSISNLLNNISVTQENEAFVSNILNSSITNGSPQNNSVSLIYTPTYKFSK